MTENSNSLIEQKRYFTVEFLCDNLEQARELCKELQDKYDIACRKENGVRISSWLDGKIPNPTEGSGHE